MALLTPSNIGSYPEQLTLVIRFASSMPDVRLEILRPQTKNAATLITLIRPHLPPTLSTCPLRLIYTGALLPANKPLSSSLRLSVQSPSKAPQPPQQYYIHCSIASDTFLTSKEIEDEVHTGARYANPSNASTTKDRTGRERGEDEEQEDDENDTDRDDSNRPKALDINAARESRSRNAAQAAATDTTEVSPSSPAPQLPPQGFDRLLAAGLTPAEVASLRSQFLAIQSHTHTPDTMPTASELRALEERWLDNGATGGGATAAAAGVLAGNGAAVNGGGGGFVDDTEAGGLEDMLWGNVMGFFWAVGAIVWLVREEGVWSKRRQIGVVTGVLVNLAFCFLRVGS